MFAWLRRRFRPSPRPSLADHPHGSTLAALGSLIGGTPERPALYLEALMHRSFARDALRAELVSNERLEFLGDAVLDLIVGEHLFRSNLSRSEGELTRLRARLVSGRHLGRTAQALDLGQYLLLGANTAQTGGRHNETILADAYEALVGALYLDQGIEAARQFVESTLLQPGAVDQIIEQGDGNHKSALLELAQSRGFGAPVYEVVTESGPPHERVFAVVARLGGQPVGSGSGRNKKEAEQAAAHSALLLLRANEPPMSASTERSNGVSPAP